MKKNKTANYAPLNFILASVAGFFIVGLSLALLKFGYFKQQTSNIVGSGETPSPTVSATPAAPTYQMLDKIKEGISILKLSPALKYETKKNQPASLIRKQIALAILDKKTGEVFEKRIWVSEEDIKNASQYGGIEFEPDEEDEEFLIEAKQWNSFNTFYDIAGHPEITVVANKYLLPSDSLTTLPERSAKNFSEILYSPYSADLRDESVISAGKYYLNSVVDSAFSDLDKKGVASLSTPGKSISAIISRSFIKNIILIEHIDPDSFSISGDNGRELAERMLVIIGANKERAYRYTGSPAGAYGLAQFIKSTYENILAKYPTAGLQNDFYLGMADHINAVEAMVLFFDYYKMDILKKITVDIAITDEILAVSYNGGTTRVINSINKYGQNWLQAQIDLPEEKRILRTETVDYARKYRSISALGIF